MPVGPVGSYKLVDVRKVLDKDQSDDSALYLPRDAQNQPQKAAERMLVVRAELRDANGNVVRTSDTPFWVYAADDAALAQALADKIASDVAELAKAKAAPVTGLQIGVEVPT